MPSSPLLASPLEQLVAVADYQFGHGAGEALFKGRIRIVNSSRTGRIRHVYDEKRNLIATLRTKDGYLALAPEGAERLLKVFESPRLRVIVQSDVGEFIRKGRNVFAKHVRAADEAIRPEAEVLVVDEVDRLLCVGKAILSGSEMNAFKTGAAVKTRRGADE